MLVASQLKKHQKATIQSLEEGVFKQKLLEMGCTPGTLIWLEHKAPFGCPLTFNVQGYFLALRKEEANYLNIKIK